MQNINDSEKNEKKNCEEKRLKYSIGRFDHYYDSVNNKCTVFLAVSTFIEGILITAYPKILESVSCGIFLKFLMTLLLVFGLATMLIVIWASTPYLTSHKKSLLYFGDIATRNYFEFERHSKEETEEGALSDLRIQSYDLSIGLMKKFKMLKIAGRIMGIQFLLFIPLMIFLLYHLN